MNKQYTIMSWSPKVVSHAVRFLAGSQEISWSNITMMKQSLFFTYYRLLIAVCLLFVSLSACTKTDKSMEETEVEQDPPSTPEPEPVLEGIVVASVSGSIDQGETVVISGYGFSAKTDASLFFTDFDNGAMGEGIVGDVPWLFGQARDTPGSYRYTNNAPLTGIRVAHAAPTKTNFGRMYAGLPDLEECFVEFFYRYDIVDFTASPEAPQIQHTSLTSGQEHTSAPFFGIVVGAEGKPNITIKNDALSSEEGFGYTAYSYFGNENWHRDTYYQKNSTPGVADGMSFIRTSFGNQWTYSGKAHFLTPDEWAEPPSMTRGKGSEGKTFKRFYFPFYQGAQQSTILDINHIYIHNSLERVYLSTSPTATASTDFKHVTCPTINRRSTRITIKSMIGCLPANEAVYLYVVNADNEMNEEGFLVRAAP